MNRFLLIGWMDGFREFMTARCILQILVMDTGRRICGNGLQRRGIYMSMTPISLTSTLMLSRSPFVA